MSYAPLVMSRLAYVQSLAVTDAYLSTLSRSALAIGARAMLTAAIDHLNATMRTRGALATVSLVIDPAHLHTRELSFRGVAEHGGRRYHFSVLLRFTQYAAMAPWTTRYAPRTPVPVEAECDKLVHALLSERLEIPPGTALYAAVLPYHGADLYPAPCSQNDPEWPTPSRHTFNPVRRNTLPKAPSKSQTSVKAPFSAVAVIPTPAPPIPPVASLEKAHTVDEVARRRKQLIAAIVRCGDKNADEADRLMEQLRTLDATFPPHLPGTTVTPATLPTTPDTAIPRKLAAVPTPVPAYPSDTTEQEGPPTQAADAKSSHTNPRKLAEMFAPWDE